MRMAAQREKRLARQDEVPHGRSGYDNWGCRCDVCRESRNQQQRGAWDVSRMGSPFTPDDLALVVRDDLTISQIAASLQRTYQAVVIKRYRLRRSA